MSGAECCLGQSLLADIVIRDIIPFCSNCSSSSKKCRLRAGDYIYIRYIHYSKRYDLFFTVENNTCLCYFQISELTVSLVCSVSEKYRRFSDEHQRLKKEIIYIKRAIAEICYKAESRLDQDCAIEVEESLITNYAGRKSLVATSGLKFDFSKVFFPELAGSPTTFWGGSFAEEPTVLLKGFYTGFFVGSPARAQNSRNI